MAETPNFFELGAHERSRREIEKRKRQDAERQRALKAQHEEDLREINALDISTGPRAEGYPDLTDAEREERAEKMQRWLDGTPAHLL